MCVAAIISGDNIMLRLQGYEKDLFLRSLSKRVRPILGKRHKLTLQNHRSLATEL
jgi:hypothetical protein